MSCNNAVHVKVNREQIISVAPALMDGSRFITKLTAPKISKTDSSAARRMRSGLSGKSAAT